MMQYNVMTQPRPYEDEVALYDEDYDSGYDEVHEPDEAYYRSISMEEVRERLHKVVDKLYAKK